MDSIVGLSSAIIFLYDFPQQLIEVINQKVIFAQRIVSPLIYTLVGIEIVTIGITMAMGSMSNGGTVLLRVFKIVFIFFIVTNIDKLGYVLLDGFRYIAFRVLDSPLGKGQTDTKNIFDNPTEMLNQLKELFVEPLKAELQRVHDLKENTQGGLGAKIIEPLIFQIKTFMITLVYYIVFILFSVLFLQLLIAKLEFAVVIFFSVVLIPFMINEKLKFLSENVFVAIFGCAIKIAMTYFMMGIVFNLLTSSGEKMFTHNGSTAMGIETIISFLIYIALALYLSFFGPRIAMTLICGRPQLGLSQMLQTAAYSATPTNMAMRSIGRKIVSGAQGVSDFIKEGKDALSHMKGNGGYAGSAQAKRNSSAPDMNQNFKDMYSSRKNDTPKENAKTANEKSDINKKP